MYRTRNVRELLDEIRMRSTLDVPPGLLYSRSLFSTLGPLCIFKLTLHVPTAWDGLDMHFTGAVCHVTRSSNPQLNIAQV